MFLTNVFWKSGFQISGIPDPDFKSGQKIPVSPGFPEFFWSVFDKWKYANSFIVILLSEKFRKYFLKASCHSVLSDAFLAWRQPKKFNEQFFLSGSRHGTASTESQIVRTPLRVKHVSAGKPDWIFFARFKSINGRAKIFKWKKSRL